MTDRKKDQDPQPDPLHRPYRDKVKERGQQVPEPPSPFRRPAPAPQPDKDAGES